LKIEDLNKDALNEYDPTLDEDVIGWSKDRKLTWADFKGSPDPDDKHIALTNSIGYRKCDPEIIKNKSGYEIKLVNIKTFALFRKSSSWVKESVLSGQNRNIILEHEQGHFDISEIFRRKFEKELQIASKKTYLCRGNSPNERQSYAGKKLEKILNKIGRVVNVQRDAYNKKYEDETAHGDNSQVQKKYTSEIRSLLKTHV